MKDTESRKDYINNFLSDFTVSKNEIERNVGNKVFVYTYPYGKYSNLSEALLMRAGNKVTVTTEANINTLIKGLPQSLYSLRRLSSSNEITSDNLCNIIEQYRMYN